MLWTALPPARECLGCGCCCRLTTKTIAAVREAVVGPSRYFAAGFGRYRGHSGHRSSRTNQARVCGYAPAYVQQWQCFDWDGSQVLILTLDPRRERHRALNRLEINILRAARTFRILLCALDQVCENRLWVLVLFHRSLPPTKGARPVRHADEFRGGKNAGRSIITSRRLNAACVLRAEWCRCSTSLSG